MKPISLLAGLFLWLLLDSCNKTEDAAAACDTDAPTIRTVTNKRAEVRSNATVDGVYLVEEGTIDTQLIPCNFPMEFYQHGLQVIISGEVKAAPTVAGRPCCFENIVLTSITR